MGESTSEHWNARYSGTEPEGLTWFEAVPDLSLELVAAHVTTAEAVIDIGGGVSRLPGELLDRGYTDVTVLDISETALAISREQLGDRASRVHWITADIREWQPERRYHLWHDRAVFHFLTDREDQARYIRTMHGALEPGGHAVIMTFAKAGPEKCSGLPVQRYDPLDLVIRLEEVAPGGFALEKSGFVAHDTPGGAVQAFQWSVVRRTTR